MGTSEYTNVDIKQHKGKKAFVLRGAMYGSCVSFMAEMGFSKADTVEDADVVVFIGGADVNPKLYKEDPISGVSGFDDDRDIYEEAVYRKCVKLGKTMFGICRGAQFLHVMNGGSLWQDVNNHAGKDHTIVDIDSDVRLKSTSLHHQMLQLNDEINIIAICENQVATCFKSEGLFVNLEKEGANAVNELEIEAGEYEKTKCFFVQGHPEIGSPEFKAWTSSKLYQHMKKDGNSRPIPNSFKVKEMVDKIVENLK